MNLLSIEAINRSYSHNDHWQNIKVVSHLHDNQFLNLLSVFQYGRIVGIQEERARRNRKEISSPVIFELYVLKSLDEICKAYKEIDNQEVISKFESILQEFEIERGQEVSPRVKDLLKEIIKIKGIEEKEKSH